MAFPRDEDEPLLSDLRARALVYATVEALSDAVGRSAAACRRDVCSGCA